MGEEKVCRRSHQDEVEELLGVFDIAAEEESANLWDVEL